MKTDIHIRNRTVQLVLTPENDLEKKLAEYLRNYKGPLAQNRTCNATIHNGQYYDCAGGWYREGGEESIILVIDDEQDTQPE